MQMSSLNLLIQESINMSVNDDDICGKRNTKVPSPLEIHPINQYLHY